MKFPFMLRSTHERALVAQEQRLIRSCLDEINLARLVMHDAKEWQRRLQKAARTGHHCDASVEADAVAQAMLSRMRPNG